MLVLSSGTAISQLILVLISPVLTRLYTPEAFGVYAVFLSITAIIGGNINLKYEQAIMLPDDADDAYKLSYLANYLNLIFSFLLLIIIAVFYKQIACVLKVDHQTSYWLYLVPFATYFIGFNTILVNLNNRFKNYKSMSGSVIAKNGAMTLVQLLLGFFKLFLNSGLIIGQLVAYVFGNRVLQLNVDFSFKQMFKHKFSNFKAVMERYKDFPRYAFPAGIANAATLNISNLLILSVYSASNVGFFSLANRILGAPSVLISQSIAKVYYQKASEDVRRIGNCRGIFNSTFKKLFFLSLPIFIPTALLSDWAFPFIFGADWREAGVFASYLSLMFGLRFISSALSITINVTDHQKYGLYINLMLLLLNISVIVVSSILKCNMINFILIYSLAMSLAYLVFIYIYFRLSGNKTKIV